MPNAFSPLEKAALLFLAGYLEQSKSKVLAAVIQPVSYGVDEVVNFIKNAEPHGGLASLLDAGINAFLNNMETDIKANAPAEIGALIDYVSTEITNLAAKV